MSEKGQLHDLQYLEAHEKDAINLFREADENVLEFMERQDEYIRILEGAVHDAIFALEEAEYTMKIARGRLKKVKDYKPFTMVDIKKATQCE